MVIFPQLPILPPSLNISNDKGQPDQGHTDGQPDTKDVLDHPTQMELSGPSSARGTGEFDDVDGEKAREKTQRQEHDRHYGEDHDGLALSGRLFGLFALKPGLDGICVLLLQIQDLGQIVVDAFGLSRHASQIQNVQVDEPLLFADLAVQVEALRADYVLGRSQGGVEIVEHLALLAEHAGQDVQLVFDVFALDQQGGLLVDVQEIVDERVRRLVAVMP